MNKNICFFYFNHIYFTQTDVLEIVHLQELIQKLYNYMANLYIAIQLLAHGKRQGVSSKPVKRALKLYFMQDV